MHTPTFALVLIVAALAWSSTSSAAGNLYRWVDAQGQIHFSDQPHGNAQRLNLHVPDAAASAQPPPAAAIDGAACKQDKARLARYRKATTITETSSLGETHTFTPEEKQKLIARTQESVNKTCGESAALAEASSTTHGGSAQ